LTDKGVELIDELLPLIRASHARIVKRVPQEAIAPLVDLLTLIGGDYSPVPASATLKKPL
jgi:hypothetical protein